MKYVMMVISSTTSDANQIAPEHSMDTHAMEDLLLQLISEQRLEETITSQLLSSVKMAVRITTMAVVLHDKLKLDGLAPTMQL